MGNLGIIFLIFFNKKGLRRKDLSSAQSDIFVSLEYLVHFVSYIWNIVDLVPLAFVPLAFVLWLAKTGCSGIIHEKK